MSLNSLENPKNSQTLYGLTDKLNLFVDLYYKEKLPKVLMLTGNKGIGKSTLVSHLMHTIYDKENYDRKKNYIIKKTAFHTQYSDNAFNNIIYLSGDNYKNIKIDDIRVLKSQLLKSTISSEKRFIILDDVELFNKNSLNALLKIVEEPSLKNYFILINNKTKKLIETIFSRSIEFKIFFRNDVRIQIIESLLSNNNIEPIIDYKKSNLSPGSFIVFNNIIKNNKLNVNDHFSINMEKILNLYKKEKNINFIKLILHLADLYFVNVTDKKFDKIIDSKSFVIQNINKFVIYNLNQNSLINAINQKLFNE